MSLPILCGRLIIISLKGRVYWRYLVTLLVDRYAKFSECLTRGFIVVLKTYFRIVANFFGIFAWENPTALQRWYSDHHQGLFFSPSRHTDTAAMIISLYYVHDVVWRLFIAYSPLSELLEQAMEWATSCKSSRVALCFTVIGFFLPL